MADISATQQERFYFHQFRHLVDEGLINHVDNGTAFWVRSLPQYCHRDEAIKHASVALSASYHNFLMSSATAAGRAPSDIEVFSINQYSRSMMALAKKQDGPDSMEEKRAISLFCCIMFFSIECIAGNWRGALRHLSSGLKIISELPLEALLFAGKSKKGGRRTGQSPRPLSDDLRYVVALLANWEVSAGFFSEKFKPVIATRLYALSKLDERQLRPFGSVLESHILYSKYGLDVYALAWETRHHRGDRDFWEQPGPKLQLEILQRRGRELQDLMDAYIASPSAPAADTDEYLSLWVDKLQGKGCYMMCGYMPYRVDEEPPAAEHEMERQNYREIITMIKLLREGRPPRKWYTIDVGCLLTLYVAIYNTRDAEVRETILSFLEEWPRRENLWYGPDVARMYRVAQRANLPPRETFDEMPWALAFHVGIPDLEAKMAEMNISG